MTSTNFGDSGDQPIKLLYLAKRKPELNRDQFMRRWRKHGALGMSFTLWTDVESYAHCDIRGEIDGAGQGHDSPFDGFGMIWYHPGGSASGSVPEEGEAMLADEMETFSAPVPTAMLLGHEYRAVDRLLPIAAKAVRLIRWSNPGATDAAISRWNDYAARTTAADDTVIQHRLTIPLEPIDPASVLHCDVVDEIGFLSLDDLTAFAKTTDLTTLRDADGAAIATAQVFVANEVVLYDEKYLVSL
jgi:hypothetical protein